MRMDIDDFVAEMVKDNITPAADNQNVKSIGEIIEAEAKKAFENALKTDPIEKLNNAGIVQKIEPKNEPKNEPDDDVVDNVDNPVDNDNKED